MIRSDQELAERMLRMSDAELEETVDAILMQTAQDEKRSERARYAVFFLALCIAWCCGAACGASEVYRTCEAAAVCP